MLDVRLDHAAGIHPTIVGYSVIASSCASAAEDTKAD
jgi:hypothetical protein